MSEDPQDFLCSDDSGTFDFFPSSPTSHGDRFTSPCLMDSSKLSVDAIGSKPRSLPLELIEYIIELFHRQDRSFRAIRPLSEVNSRFRSMAMQRYMASLSICSTQQLASLARVHTSMLLRSNPAWGCIGFHWVKHLSAQSGDLAKAPWEPRAFSRLRDLHISFAAEIRSTQHTRCKQIFTTHLASSPMTQLTSLTLTGLWRIDACLLRMISEAFSGLTSLHLSCSEHIDVSCCWTCFEDSSSAAVHSPIPNHFSTVVALTDAFAKALTPLVKLTDLHLGLFLSDEEMLENHIDHYDSPGAYSRALLTTVGQNRPLARTDMIMSQSESPRTAEPEHTYDTQDEERSPQHANDTPDTAFHEVPPFPHGPEMCPICSITLSVSDVRARELKASLALARKLKSLQTISWSSFFAWQPPSEDERRVGDWQRMTKTYILRDGGRVRVRRRPWA